MNWPARLRPPGLSSRLRMPRCRPRRTASVPLVRHKPAWRRSARPGSNGARNFTGNGSIDAELRQFEGRLQFLGEQQQQVRTQLEAWSLRQSTLTDELERRRATTQTADRDLRDVEAEASIIEQRVGEADRDLDAARKAVVEHEARLKA